MRGPLQYRYKNCTSQKATDKVAIDGVYFVIKDEKAKEAETEVKKWLQKIKVIKDAP